MKRIILLIIVCLLLGCSSKINNNEKEINILFTTPLKEHKVWLKAKKGFEDICALYELNCEWQGPIAIDIEKMNDTIETGIMKKVDGIITQGVVSEELVNEAVEKNIPVILVDSDMPSSKRVYYMGKDFHLQAKMLLEDIQKRIGNNTYLKIAIQVANADFIIAKDQIKEIREVFSEYNGGFEIVSISQSYSDSVRSKKEWERVLNEEKDINIAINFAGESAPFCAEAAKELNFRDNLLIYGVDDLKDTLKGVKNGDIDGTIVTSFYDYGYKSVEIILDLMKNKKLNKNYATKIKLVTKENIKDYEKK